ncbi:hypothetical protein A4W82_06055 [Latilactobacillus sakei]|nr:hypothetical protein A4W82_06055 [Latilactobacillus sakei]
MKCYEWVKWIILNISTFRIDVKGCEALFIWWKGPWARKKAVTPYLSGVQSFYYRFIFYFCQMEI